MEAAPCRLSADRPGGAVAQLAWVHREVPPRDRDSTLRASRSALNDRFEGARTPGNRLCNNLRRPTHAWGTRAYPRDSLLRFGRRFLRQRPEAACAEAGTALRHGQYPLQSTSPPSRKTTKAQKHKDNIWDRSAFDGLPYRPFPFASCLRAFVVQSPIPPCCSLVRCS